MTIRNILSGLFLLCLGVGVQAQGNKVVSASILLNQKNAPNFNTILTAIRNEWKIKADSVNLDDKTLVFSTTEGTVMLAYLDYPAPKAEIEPAAGISWLWKTAEQETAAHQAQVVISVIGSIRRAVPLYQLTTKIGAAAMSQMPGASGIFFSAQYVVAPKGYFIEAARNMTNDDLPLHCWVYFGLLRQQDKSTCYTYGMQEFGFPDMEIVQSDNSLTQTHAVLFDAAEYVLRYNITATDGRAIPIGDGQKISTTYSDGVSVKEAKTVKLAF
jgi:Domain of unknown function (DUF4261)